MDNSREYGLDVAVAGIVGASRGWRYDSPSGRRRNARVLGGDNRTIAVQHLLERLDADLGVRLRPQDQRRLRRSSLNHPDTLTDAVLDADGLDPRVVPSLRGQVRSRVAEWLLALRRTD